MEVNSLLELCKVPLKVVQLNSNMLAADLVRYALYDFCSCKCYLLRGRCRCRARNLTSRGTMISTPIWIRNGEYESMLIELGPRLKMSRKKYILKRANLTHL